LAGGWDRLVRRLWLTPVAFGVLAAAATAVLPQAALRWARPAVMEAGPNDRDYLRGFRPDWERDGQTRFRWTSPAASVRLPLRIGGEGHVLRMRIRRHFIDPARVRLRIEGRTVAAFDVQAETKVPYRIVEVSLPPLDGRHPFELSIEAASAGPRPLGFALDWLEVERRGPGARFALLPSARRTLAAVGAAAVAAPLLAGAPPLAVVASTAGLLAAVSVGAAWDVIALERILREGMPPLLTAALLMVLAMRWGRSRAALGVPTGGVAGALVLVVLWAVGLRLVLLLHPQFYYPDVKVHALFAWELARRGLDTFLRDFTLNQFRYSLGLQFESGHWYAFPYPPAFYVLAWPLVRIAEYRPEVAVSALGAFVNALEAVCVFAIARRLTAAPDTAIGAAAVHALLPLFTARLTLAYFPALVGHAVDAVVIGYLLARLDQLDRPRVVAALSLLLALALLVYTQALLNFGLLIPLFAAAQLAFDRGPGARRRVAGLVVAGGLGLALATAAFYGRYVPTLLDMRRGVPMPEEKVLLDRLERERHHAEAVHEEPDPYTGDHLDLGRGLAKAAWRLHVFYGPFAAAVIVGTALVLRSSHGASARWVATWGTGYLLLNLASGGLPGPNLVRYNKDLELIAPLCCLALATVGFWLWRRVRLLGALYGLAYLLFSLHRAAGYLTEKFVLER